MTRVAERMEPIRVVAGGTVIREGDASDAFFIVVHGRLGAYQTVDGEERQVNELRKGDFFGEIGLLSGEPRGATVRAIEPSELLRLDRGAFQELVSSSEATREQLSHVADERRARVAARR
jgi:cAMP-dependent protein kinase regulator